MAQTRTSRALVDRQVNELTLVLDAKSAGTESGSADDGNEPEILLGGNQAEGAAFRTGQNGEKGGVDRMPQPPRPFEGYHIGGLH